jgi:hypothetical protein
VWTAIGQEPDIGCLLPAFWLALHYRPYLVEGEHGVITIVAADRKQARNILRFIRGFLEIPLLAKRVLRATAEGVDLKNRVSLEISTASHRSIRGYSVVARLTDELAFWPVDELRVEGRVVICLSAFLWQGRRGDIGLEGCNAGNESDGQAADHPAVAASEYMAEFRSDLARVFARGIGLLC